MWCLMGEKSRWSASQLIWHSIAVAICPSLPSLGQTDTLKNPWPTQGAIPSGLLIKANYLFTPLAINPLAVNLTQTHRLTWPHCHTLTLSINTHEYTFIDQLPHKKRLLYASIYFRFIQSSHHTLADTTLQHVDFLLYSLSGSVDSSTVLLKGPLISTPLDCTAIS